MIEEKEKLCTAFGGLCRGAKKMWKITCDLCGVTNTQAENTGRDSNGHPRKDIESAYVTSGFEDKELDQVCKKCYERLSRIKDEEKKRHQRRLELRLKALRYEIGAGTGLRDQFEEPEKD